MSISAKTIKDGKALLDLLTQAQDLRSYLNIHPSDKLALYALAKDDTMESEIQFGRLEPDLRLAVADYLIERLKARLGDLDIDLP